MFGRVCNADLAAGDEDLRLQSEELVNVCQRASANPKDFYVTSRVPSEFAQASHDSVGKVSLACNYPDFARPS